MKCWFQLNSFNSNESVELKKNTEMILKISSRETTNHIIACSLLKSKKKKQLSKKGKMVKNIMFAMGEGVLEIPEIPNPNSKIKL